MELSAWSANARFCCMIISTEPSSIQLCKKAGNVRHEAMRSSRLELERDFIHQRPLLDVSKFKNIESAACVARRLKANMAATRGRRSPLKSGISTMALKAPSILPRAGRSRQFVFSCSIPLGLQALHLNLDAPFLPGKGWIAKPLNVAQQACPMRSRIAHCSVSPSSANLGLSGVSECTVGRTIKHTR